MWRHESKGLVNFLVCNSNLHKKLIMSIDRIYGYFAGERLAPEAARRQAKRLKTAILKLDTKTVTMVLEKRTASAKR